MTTHQQMCHVFCRRFLLLDLIQTNKYWINIAIFFFSFRPPDETKYQPLYWKKKNFLISFKVYNAKSISEIQSHSNIPVMKTITIWSLLKSLQHPVKNIDHDSDSRLRDIIILITSLEPLGETKEFKGHTNWVCCWIYSGKDKNIYIIKIITRENIKVWKLTLEDLMYSNVSDKLLHGVVFQVTVSSVHLKCLVANLCGYNVENVTEAQPISFQLKFCDNSR